MNKKGQAVEIISIAVISVVALFALIVLGVYGYFLSKNPFVLLGIMLAAIGAVGLLMRWSPGVAFALIVTGIFLIFVPTIFKNTSGWTLSAFVQR